MRILRNIALWVYEVSLGVIACSFICEYVYPGSVSSYFDIASLVVTCGALFVLLSVLGRGQAGQETMRPVNGFIKFLVAGTIASVMGLMVMLSLGQPLGWWGGGVALLVGLLVICIYYFLDS